MRESELRRFQNGPGFAAWRWPEPTLIVVDNAASVAAIVRDWFETLAARVMDPDGPLLRILLLERNADEGGQEGWWGELMRPGSLSSRGPSDLASPKHPVALSGLDTVASRRDLLTDAMALAAKIRGIDPAPRPPAPGADPAFDQNLADETVDNAPLYLMMAGIVAIATASSPAILQPRDELASRIARGEADRISAIASGRMPPRFATHLSACVTLQGGCGLEAAARLVGEERSAIDGAAVALSTEEIVTVLADCLPQPRGFLGLDAIRPDLIGEAFVIAEIARPKRSPEAQYAIIERARKRSDSAVRRTLTFAAQDFARGDGSHPTNQWRGRLMNASTQEFGDQLRSGALTPDDAAIRIRQIGLSMGHWKTLTGMLAPLAPKLSPDAFGVYASLRVVSFVETSDYQNGIAFAEWVLKRKSLPDGFRPEIYNALGRSNFELKQYPVAAEAYRKGMEASSANPSLLSQLYVNLGNAYLGDQNNAVRNIPAAIDAVKGAVRLADDPRMEVDARCGLSTAFIDQNDYGQAETALNEAWSMAQRFHRAVPDKSRAAIMRNLGTVHILQPNLKDRAMRELDAAIQFAVAHFTMCHVEAINMFDYCMLFLAMALPTGKSVEQALKALQRAERECSRGSAAWARYGQVAIRTLDLAVRRGGGPMHGPEINEIFNSRMERGWDDAGIARLVELVADDGGARPKP